MELLDPKEVLKHLNERGFHNISAHQLKEFMYDLKKLIKYDAQMQQRKIQEQELEREKLFDYLYKTSTTSFAAKQSKKKQEYIPIPPEKRKPIFIQQDCAGNRHNKIHHEHQNKGRPDYSKYNMTPDTYNDEIYESCESLCSDSIDPELINEKSDTTVPAKSSKSKAFIRPRMHVKKPIKKSDPVALYQAYQSDWQKFKNQMPGQTNRNSLRWNIREKMMG